MAGRHVLVVGARGLLGGAVLRVLRSRGDTATTVRVPWSDPDAAVDALTDAARRVHEASAGDWTLVWAAGAGVVGATTEVLDAELRTIDGLVRRLSAPGGPRPSLLFFASSAGAVYAGSDGPPFTEASVPVPLGDYGVAKLRAEEAVLALAPRTRVLVGRISNLYGPGQDLTKNQGLVTRLCLSYLVREPIGVYVSMDTIRDYLYVDDCAELVHDGLERLAAAPADEVAAGVTKILASNRAASIALLLGECRRVFGRKVLVRMVSSDLARQQGRDLRMRSAVWPELDRRATTPLPHGIHATVLDLRERIGHDHAVAPSR